MDYQNKQLYCECQLVSVWNAARFWGYEDLVPKMGTRKYKSICKKARCLCGSAININFEIERLGLGLLPLSWRENSICELLPCAMKVFCERGYHSVLAIAHKNGKKNKSWTNKFLITNWRKYHIAWISWGEILACAALSQPPMLIAPKRMIRNLAEFRKIVLPPCEEDHSYFQK